MENVFRVKRLKIEELSAIIANKNKNLDYRKEALNKIYDIISKRPVTEDQLTNIINNIFDAFINTKDIVYKINIISVAGKLLDNNIIGDVDIQSTKYLLLISLLDSDEDVKRYSIRSLGAFLRKKVNQLDDVSSRQIIESLYENADNEDDVIRNNSIWNLNIIIEAKKVPLDMQSDVINLLIEKYRDVDMDVRNRSIGGLSHLVTRFELKDTDVLDLISIFTNSTKDDNSINKSSALLGIAKLARKNLIPEDNITKTIQILKDHSRDSCNDARCNATSALVSLSQYNRIPEDKKKVTRVIFNLCLVDSYTYVRQNGVFGLTALNKEVKERDVEKRKHEIIGFKIRSPLEYPILITISAPKVLDNLAIELDAIRQKLRAHVNYTGTYNDILQREEMFRKLDETTLSEAEEELIIFREKIKSLKETDNGDNLSIVTDPDYFYIEELAEYMSVYFSTQQGRGIEKDKRDLIYCYQAYFIYERNEEGISKDNLDELMTLYDYCEDPEYNVEILKIISKLLTKEARFYLSEEYENKLQQYNKDEYKKDSLEQNMDMLDIIIANFRQRFVNEHMQEREHQISRDARYAIDIDKDEVPSICSNKIIVIPDILANTKVKEITKTKEVPISFRKLAKFRPHIISPGSVMFGVNLEIIEEKSLVYEYNSFLRFELVKSGFLDSSFNVNLDIGKNTVNREELVVRTIELTKDFFKQNDIDQAIINEEIFKRSLNDNFDKITRNRENSSHLMKGFILKEVVSLLFVIEKTDPIVSVDSKLNTCLLEKESHREICKMLKRLAETVIMISDSFPLPGQVSISGHNNAWKIAGGLLSKLEKGESMIIPTGTPIKPGAKESSHFFYVLLKHIKEDPNKVKLVIVNAGDNIESAINVDKNFAAEDVSSAGNYLLCRETRPIDLTKKDEREFLKHYIYKALVLPYIPVVKDKGNDMNK